MPLPSGVWKVNVNGKEGELRIDNISTQGAVDGALFNSLFRGLWDETSQTLTFSVLHESDLPVPLPFFKPHFFRGCLFGTPPQPEPGQDIVWTLAGIVVDTVGVEDHGIKGTPRRSEFGWSAHFTQVV